MTTYSKETALYDTGAISDDIEEAGTKASKFLSSDSSGIMVYDGSNGQQTPSNPSSTTNNVFIDDNSLDIRRGTDVLATFGADGARIGIENGENINISGSGIIGNTQNGRAFKISTSDTEAEIVERYTLYDSQGTITIKQPPTNTQLKVLLKGSRSQDYIGYSSFPYGVSKNTNYMYNADTDTKVHMVYDGANNFTFETINMTESVFVDTIRLKVISQSMTPSFSFGTRTEGSTEGGYSFSAGQELIGSKNYQFVMGRYNEPNNHIFVIGYGLSDDERKNLVSVDGLGHIHTNESMYVHHTNYDSTSSAMPPATIEYAGLELRDTNNHLTGMINSVEIGNTTRKGMRLCAERLINNQYTKNEITPWIDSSGTLGYSIGSPVAFRKAIHLKDAISFQTATSTNNSYTSGQTKTITITNGAFKSGCTAIAIRGWNVNASSSGGANPSGINVFSCMISGNNVVIETKNNAASNAKVDFYVYVTFIENY